MVKCPICEKEIPLGSINEHLDSHESNHIDASAEQTKLDSLTAEEDDVEIQEIREVSSKKRSSLGLRMFGEKPKQPKRTESFGSTALTPKKPKAEPIDYSSNNQTDHGSVCSHTYSQDRVVPTAEEITKQLKMDSMKPLAERLRPKTLNDYIGQDHLVGPEGILRGFIENDRVPSIILWGPPGVGKTSIARIIAQTTSSRFIEISATMNNTSDIKKIFEESKNEMKLMRRRTILFVDEIHRFNKLQQDLFLPPVERGDITLVGATTENPSFQLNSALLSRCKVFVLTKMSIENITKVINKGILLINKTRKLVQGKSILKLEKEAVDYLSDLSDGDSRAALNLLEIVNGHFSNLTTTNPIHSVTADDLRKILKKTHMIYDRVGDAHYDTISAFHKSIRGSNPDAAMYYLARMLKGGENPLYIARRMIRIASEDVGVLDDSCLPFAVAAYQAVQFVGMPEADLALVHCCVKLAKAPKSVEICKGWNELNSLLGGDSKYLAPIPVHLRNAPTKLMKELEYGKEYKYNPNYRDGKVKQDYFPIETGELQFLHGKHLGDMIDDDL